MRRGWEIELFDGTIVNEAQMDWNKAPKTDIRRLTLRYDGREWNIFDKIAYLQKKRASAVPGDPKSFRIESRSIGYYEGNQKVWYTVDENTGRMLMSVEEI